ncbi:MAG: extracellular solute-binding protein [Alphaproteobacteria bacterium]|nr:extracellular solute-binding protein [Alphaproteobacteria bacterium]MBU2142692.1 extracellular solute-binding protein [Alphaproteobacteria bacterium]MBU2196540.1 extracellular solute-binding protein [Alphaproteobacteria bacterium]
MKFPVLFTAIALFAVACGKPAEPAATNAEPVAAPAVPGAGVLNVYSARHYDSDKVMYDAFEAETGIHVRFRESGAPELIETMKAEGDQSPADIIIASDAGTLFRFQDAGFTQPIRSETLEAAIPPHFREPDGNWFGLAKRARIIVYDPTRLKPEDVAHYQDLADGKLQGEICMRSSSNIYNLSLMGEFIGRWGADKAAEWARNVVANFARPPQGGDTTQIESIAAGECSAALINHYYWVRMTTGSDADKAKTAKTALSFPEQDGVGTHINVTAASVAAHAPNKDNAVRFIEWLVTPEGQKMLTEETKEFPMIAGVPLPEGLEALPEFKQSEFALEQLGVHQSEAQEIYDRAGWN